MSSAEAAEQAARAIAQKSHEKTAAYFAASMLGLMAVFTIFHWIGNILQDHRSDNENALSRPFIIISR
jgi:predicted MFS family arabinose efflux permease